MAPSIKKLASICFLALALSSCATQKKNRAEIYELANEISDLKTFNDSTLGREEQIISIMNIQTKTMSLYLDIFKGQRNDIEALKRKVVVLENPPHFNTDSASTSSTFFYSGTVNSIAPPKAKLSIKHSKHK